MAPTTIDAWEDEGGATGDKMETHTVTVQTITVGKRTFALTKPLVVVSPITPEALLEALEIAFLLGYASEIK